MMVLPLILAFSLSTTPMLESDPGVVSSSTTAPDYSVEEKVITAEIARQYQSWTARNIDGYMAPFWKSPLLVYIVDSYVMMGWDSAYGLIQRDFPVGHDAGNPALERLQINIAGPDAAVSVEWWTVHFKAVDVHGNTSSSWRKFPEGWRIIECHTSSSEFSNQASTANPPPS
jgi:Protein of unknown function (DUF3225)